MSAGTAKRNCLWCARCTQYDEGLYHCSDLDIVFGHAKASAARKCPGHKESWCRADGNGGWKGGGADGAQVRPR